MKKLIALILLLASSWCFAAQPSHNSLEAGMVNPGYQEKPSWFKESFLDVREDIAEAKAVNKRAILYFYQDGCPYCAKLLRDNFGNTDIANFTQQHFEVIALNLWGDKEVVDLSGNKTTEKAFAQQLKVQFTPTLLCLDESGNAVLRANGYYTPEKFQQALNYVAGKHEGKGSFAEYLAQKKPRVEPVLEPIAATLPKPLKLQEARNSGRALVVLFEKADCGEPCAELRGILKRKEIAIALSNLDVAMVDPSDDSLLQTPNSKVLKASEWAKNLAIHYSPSLVFFDSLGAEVFRNEAYFKAFHVHGALDYVTTGAYRWQPEFQRFLQQRREILQQRGLAVDLLE